jgi:hypothetical protein
MNVKSRDSFKLEKESTRRIDFDYVFKLLARGYALLIAQGINLNLIINSKIRFVPFVAHFRQQIDISPPFSIFI